MLLSTRSLSGYGLDQIFALAKAGECSGLDLSVDFSLFDTYDSVYLSSLIARHDIPIENITAPGRRMTKKHAEMILNLAENLGVKVVNFSPPHRSDRDKDWFSEGLKILITKHPNITIQITNAPPKTWLFVISEYGDARPETIKKITSHTALSIANIEPESGVDLMKTFTLLGSSIGLVYFSDKTEEEIGLFPGEGSMPLESLLIRMKEAGYSGNFTLDIDPHSLAVGDDSTVVSQIKKAGVFLEKYFG